MTKNHMMQQHAEQFDQIHQTQVQNYGNVTEIIWLAKV